MKSGELWYPALVMRFDAVQCSSLIEVFRRAFQLRAGVAVCERERPDVRFWFGDVLVSL